ncbi:10085_t:CDS:2, partial [Funneliformis geosporum]
KYGESIHFGKLGKLTKKECQQKCEISINRGRPSLSSPLFLRFPPKSRLHQWLTSLGWSSLWLKYPDPIKATTGQKIPQLGGTMAEVQTALQQLQLTQSQIITNQNQIYQHLEQLKTNATQQLTNLTDQFKSLRLTHTQKKEIEFNSNLPLKENQDY